jgi:hypothetical protein
MSYSEKRFQLLAEQFKVLEHNLSVSQNAEQRQELLKAMNTVIVIEELDQLILGNQTWLDSKLASIAPTNRHLGKAAHQ